MPYIPPKVVNKSALQWKIGLIIFGIVLILAAIGGSGDNGGMFAVGLICTIIGGCIKTTKKLTRSHNTYR